ncbi:MAG: mannonate dehydratase [Kiritimatiellae bacterium]|nr:mannonate dehydratase [Kiritimatiellia bacterium]
MTLVEFVPPKPHPLWKLCLQMGITDVIIKVNPTLTGLPDPWRHETLARIVGGLKIAGLKVVGLEGDPFDMSPIKEYGERGTGNGEREEALAHYRELLESMGRLGIRLLCYNFMAGQGWSRTGVREGRGGAKATYFSIEECLGRKEHEDHKGLVPSASFAAKNNPVQGRLLISHEQVWANYEHFIKSVMPTAERCGVRMALHPDDPCLPSLGGYARIFGSVEAYDRAYALHPSPSNAVTFCQANFKLMLGHQGSGVRDQGSGIGEQLSTFNSQLSTLENVARHFRDRIAFIHVRDVEGTVEDFTELFHDQGTTDQFSLMRTYRELGLDVPVRGDHVPEMEGDRLLAADCIPGYFTLGRLFANGYLKALLEGTEEKPGN